MKSQKTWRAPSTIHLHKKIGAGDGDLPNSKSVIFLHGYTKQCSTQRDFSIREKLHSILYPANPFYPVDFNFLCHASYTLNTVVKIDHLLNREKALRDWVTIFCSRFLIQMDGWRGSIKYKATLMNFRVLPNMECPKLGLSISMWIWILNRLRHYDRLKN